jgi:N-acyl homoserine lactone hydrolase
VRLTSPSVETILDGYRLGTDQGSVAFCSVNLVQGIDEQGTLRRILIDTGHVGRRSALDQSLRQRGLTRDSIDVLFCTHAHWDHVQNLDMFPRAEVVLHPDERRYVRQPHPNDTGCPEWTDAVISRYEERVKLAEEGTRLLPGVEVVAAPGHSAGTIALAVATRTPTWPGSGATRWCSGTSSRPTRAWTSCWPSATSSIPGTICRSG